MGEKLLEAIKGINEGLLGVAIGGLIGVISQYIQISHSKKDKINIKINLVQNILIR